MNSFTKDALIARDLNSILQKFGVDFPIIILLGSQRSGKEAAFTKITGQKILPMNTELEITRPILFKLNKTESSEYAYINNDASNKLEIPKLKDYLTSTISDKNLSPSDDFLIIKLWLNTCLGFSILYVPDDFRIDYDDIKNRNYELINKEIERQTNILIAVCDSTENIFSSECVKIINKVDPTFKRSLGVISETKMMNNEVCGQETLMCLNFNRSIKKNLELESHELKINPILVTNCENVKREDLELKDGNNYLFEMILKLYFRNLKDCANIIRPNIKKHLILLHNEMSDLLNLPNLSFEQYENVIKDGVASFLIQKDILLKSDYLMAINAITTGTKDNNIFAIKTEKFFDLLVNHFKGVMYKGFPFVKESDINSDIFMYGIEEAIIRMTKKSLDRILEYALKLHESFIKVLCKKIMSIDSKRYPNLAKSLNLKVSDELERDSAELKRILEISLKPLENVSLTSPATGILDSDIKNLIKKVIDIRGAEREIYNFGSDNHKKLEKNVFQNVIRIHYNYFTQYFGHRKFTDFILQLDLKNEEEIKKENGCIENNREEFKQLMQALALLEGSK